MLFGHSDLQMATRYVQDVSKQTDRVFNNSRKQQLKKSLNMGGNRAE